MPRTYTVVWWQYETDDAGFWRNMDDDTARRLENVFSVNPKGETTISYGEHISYDYYFQEMFQQRYNGARHSRCRNIRRLEVHIREGDFSAP